MLRAFLVSLLLIILMIGGVVATRPNWLMDFIVAIVTHHDIVEAGRYKHLEIGQSPEQVLLASASVPEITEIRPEVDQRFIVDADSIDRITGLAEADGISVTKDSFSLLIAIKSNQVARIDIAPANQGNTLGITVGQSRSDVLETLAAAMKHDANLRIVNVIPNSRWINLATLTDADIKYLSSFNTWQHHGPDPYSTMTLRFSDGLLSRIEYSWSDVELP